MAAQYGTQANWPGSSQSLEQVVYSAITCSTTNALVSIVDNNDGTLTLNCVGTPGTPGAQYYLAPAADLAGSWTPVVGSTNTAADGAGWSCIVTNDASQKFYKSAAIHPAP